MSQEDLNAEKEQTLVTDDAGSVRPSDEPSLSANLPLGTIVAGHYEILSTLGNGAMGTVYAVKHQLVNSIRAVKLLNPGYSDKVLMRFQQEAKAALSLEHPNIVRVYEFGIDSKLQQPYLVMDFVEGRTLSAALAEEGPLCEERVRRVVAQICGGLAHAHSKGIVHRDIKPGNIILTKDSSGAEVSKLVDFGIAKIVTPEERQNLTQTGEVFGTPLYMSPEQCLGRKVDARSDVYSLGCVLYECLAGRPPFQGQSALETIMMHVNSDNLPDFEEAKIPANLQSVICKAIEIEPDNRFQTMSDLRIAIQDTTRNENTSSSLLYKFRRLQKHLALNVGCLVTLQVAYIAVKHYAASPDQTIITWIIFLLSAPFLLNVLTATADSSLVRRTLSNLAPLRKRSRRGDRTSLAAFVLIVLIFLCLASGIIFLSAKTFSLDNQTMKGQLIVEKRNDPITWTAIGTELERKGNLIDAELAFKKAIQLKPDCKPAWLGLGKLLQKQGRDTDADEAFKRARAL